MGSRSVTVAVWVKPGASAARVGGRHGHALIVAVRERAVEGKATEAARRALAEALQISQARVRLKSGTTSRAKLFAIQEPPSDVDDRLARLLDQP